MEDYKIMSQISKSDSYAASGVDVQAGYEVVDRITPLVKSTRIPGVIGGDVDGLFAPDISGMKKPVLVSGTDGVGTKLKLAFLMDKHDTIGIDCVAMCVNDVLRHGAKPIFFLDYLACGKTVPARMEQIVSGIAEGCRQAGCALIGGETAEMPGFYPEDEYDVAGFSVGIVDEEKMIDGKQLKVGDALIGLGSSGVHSNGYSLVRKALNINSENIKVYYDELGCTLGEALLVPTRIYVKAVQALQNGGIQVKAISHITGGSFFEKVPRMMANGLCARIHADAFPHPPIFDIIQKAGDIPAHDMYNTFNMGVGLVLAVPEEQADAAIAIAEQAGEKAYRIGTVEDTGHEGVEVLDI